MNWLEFVSSVLGSLAWPATVIVLVVVLRSPLGRILLTLTKLKYKDLELDFGRGLKELEAKAKSIDLMPSVVAEPPPSKRTATDLLNEAGRLAEEFPEPAVAVGWQAVEAELMSAVQRLAISPDYPPYNSAMKNTALLHEQGSIDTPTLDVLNRMRNLRNKAVHGRLDAMGVSGDQAREFIALARTVVEKLKTL